MDLHQKQCCLGMQSQHMHLAIDPFGDRDYGFIHRAARDREFFTKSCQQLKGEHGSTSDKIYYVNSYESVPNKHLNQDFVVCPMRDSVPLHNRITLSRWRNQISAVTTQAKPRKIWL